MPFLTVAQDGSGDFTSIIAAINAASVGVPTMIFVKPALGSVDFNDGAATVDISGKRIHVFCPAPANSHKTAGGIGFATWTLGGITKNTASGYIRIEGMNVVPSTTGLLRTDGSSNNGYAEFVNCGSVGSATIGVFPSTGTADRWRTRFQDCVQVTLFLSSSSVTFGGQHFFDNCQVGIGSSVTLSGDFILVFNGCGIDTDTITLQNSGSLRPAITISGGYLIDSCQLTVINPETFSIVGLDDTVDSSGGLTLTVSYNVSSHVSVIGNLPRSTVTVTNTAGGGGVQLAGPYIAGRFRRLVVGAQKAKVSAAISLINGSNQTALTVNNNASNCMIVAALENGSGTNNTAISLAAGCNNNLIFHSGIGDFATGVVDNGTGNQINAIAPTGTASGDLSGSYPSPTVARLQGRNVSSTAPADLDYLGWNAGASQWEPKPLAYDDALAWMGVYD
jgi:hypothetical protein